MKKSQKAKRRPVSRKETSDGPRPDSSCDDAIGVFRARHLNLSTRHVMSADGVSRILANDSESPLAWLASRKSRDGRPMISHDQFLAGERLRADFTLGQMSPRVTSNWSGIGRTRGAATAPGEMTDLIVAARQRVRLALEACGPEFAGLLMDVCCFLLGLEDVERARGWPPRSGKVVLQLGLDRLARHYGLSATAHGATAHIRTWLADDVSFTV